MFESLVTLCIVYCSEQSAHPARHAILIKVCLADLGSRRALGCGRPFITVNQSKVCQEGAPLVRTRLPVPAAQEGGPG